MKKKTALVAGGAGFIGSHLCDLLDEENYHLVIVDSLITSSEYNITHLVEKGHTFYNADVRQPLTINEPIDFIYNLASPASPIDFNPLALYIIETNTIGHQNLLELARNKKARILFASTSEIYGDPIEHPQKESYFGNVNTIGPRSCYDESKRLGETLTDTYKKKFNCDTRIARIFNTYGPRMRPNDGRIFPNFFSQAHAGQPLTIYGDGKQTRSFCYVSDLIKGLYLLMMSDETRPVNLGNTEEMTILEAANYINSITGNNVEHKYIPMMENDPLLRQPDTSRAKEVLQWEPLIDFKEGLEKTYTYFRQILQKT